MILPDILWLEKWFNGVKMPAIVVKRLNGKMEMSGIFYTMIYKIYHKTKEEMGK